MTKACEDNRLYEVRENNKAQGSCANQNDPETTKTSNGWCKKQKNTCSNKKKILNLRLLDK